MHDQTNMMNLSTETPDAPLQQRPRLFAQLGLVALLSVLSACGQKGELYMPDQKRAELATANQERG